MFQGIDDTTMKIFKMHQIDHEKEELFVTLVARTEVICNKKIRVHNVPPHVK